MSVYIVRAFVKMRELLVSQADFIHRLNELENKTDLIELKHESFEHNTRVQLKQIIDALRELSTPPEQVKKRPIGFVSSEDDHHKK